MGVCCVVYDIDGMLFELVKNSFEKIFFYEFFVNISCFLHVLCYFQCLRKNLKKFREGGGEVSIFLLF